MSLLDNTSAVPTNLGTFRSEGSQGWWCLLGELAAVQVAKTLARFLPLRLIKAFRVRADIALSSRATLDLLLMTVFQSLHLTVE